MRYLPPQERVRTSRIAQALQLAALVGVLSTAANLNAEAQEAPSSTGADRAVLTTAAADPPPFTLPPAASATTSTPSIPAFDISALVFASESYVNNASGLAGGSKSDFLSTIGLSAHLHDRTSRTELDANYTFSADFYAGGTQSAQITNNLQALASVAAVPEYLTLNLKAFASPVVTSNFGVLTAGNRIVANGYQNSFGYIVQPDLKFRLHDFATSETIAIYGSTFFSNAAGTKPIPVIPGLTGPEDMTSRGLVQSFASGEDFDRLSWDLIGDFVETKRKQGLLSDKEGTGTFKYALSHEFYLLATGGYDAISNTTPLARNVSGLIALGGFGLTFDQTFSVQVEAGRKYNDWSLIGNLRYDWSPTASIVASANDSISTPEGRLLDSLNNLIVTPNGELTSNDNLLGNGYAASLASFNLDSFGTLAFDQNISRFQTVNLSWLEDFGRNHADVSLFGIRRTFLSGVLVGPPRTDSWGGQLTLSRNINPLLLGTVSGSYLVTQELGGTARIFTADAALNYTITRDMLLSLEANYLDRQSSAVLNQLSPFTGSLSDYRITIRVTHAL